MSSRFWVLPLCLAVAVAVPLSAREIRITSAGDSATVVTINNGSGVAAPAAPCGQQPCGPNDVLHADDAMNAAYDRLRGRLDPAAFAELRSRQREWITARDAECGIRYQGPDREKWLGHVVSDEKRSLCVMRTTGERTSELLRRIRELSGVAFVTDPRRTGGKSPEELARDYWRWSRGVPAAANPSADETGRLCAQKQGFPVWFLTGANTPDRITRRCEIPADSVLVLPVLNALAQPTPGQTAGCGALESAGRQLMDGATLDHFTIDGVDFRPSLKRVNTGCFELNDLGRQIRGTVFGDGLWATLEPLPPGEHTIAFGGRFSDGFSQEVTYRLIVRPRCELPADGAEVVVIGRYGGLTPESVQLGESGNETRSSEVVVNRPDKPVVLVLSAYDPTWWKVAVTPGTTLKGVIVAGYHTQAVTGISRSVPLIKAVYEEKRSCPDFYAYRAGRNLDQAIKRIHEMTGREPASLITDPLGNRFVIGAPRFDESHLVRSADYTIEEYPVKLGLPAGQSGIEYLMREGKLRRATRDDIDQWVEVASAKYQRLEPSLKVTHYMVPDRTYVVLAPVTLPTGLYGGHLVSLLIPKDVPRPTDPGSHNGYYFLETGTCEGVCPHD